MISESQSQLINIHYTNGHFLVFNKRDAIKLRSRKITWQLVGNTHLGPSLPCLISHYAARLCLENNFAKFIHLSERNKAPKLIKEDWDCRLNVIKSVAKDDFYKQRAEELSKRGLDVTEERLGLFDETKLRIPVHLEPLDDASNYGVSFLNEVELNRILITESNKMKTFKDLFDRGFFITAGLKFGGDFLAYQGDPVLYHATFVVLVLPGVDKSIDLDKVSYMELNTILRLCHGSNKIPLFAVVDDSRGFGSKIIYWTLKTKEYIEAIKSKDDFELLDPISSKRYISSDGTSDMVNQSKRMRIDL